LAARMTSFEGFGTINNFLVMPLFFLSGAMYPIDRTPLWLRHVIVVNPLTYAVSMLRGIVLNLPTNYLLDLTVILVYAAAILSVATYVFIKEPR